MRMPQNSFSLAPRRANLSKFYYCFNLVAIVLFSGFNGLHVESSVGDTIKNPLLELFEELKEVKWSSTLKSARLASTVWNS